MAAALPLCGAGNLACGRAFQRVFQSPVCLTIDVAERVKRESRTRGASFRDTLNDLLRTALIQQADKPKRRTFRIKPSHMGYRPGLNYDSVEALLEYGEGVWHR